MGRRAKPVSVHLLNGNPSKLKLKPDTAPLAAGEHQSHDNSVAELRVPPPRPGLSPEARAHWKRLAPVLVFRGLLRETDLDSFETLCRLEAEYAALTKMISSPKKAYYTAADGKPRRHPAVADRRATLKDLRDYRDRFGLSPLARARVPMGAPSQPPLPGLGPSNPQPKPDENVAPPAIGTGDPLDAFINERPSLPN